MNHLGTQKIQTERLILRKFQLQDAKYVFENWAGDSDVTEYLSWLPHADIKVSEDYIKTLLINFFLLEVGVNKVDSMHNPINVNSGKVMQKCGMKYEGTLRSFYKDNTGIVDAAFYGILKEDLEK